MERRNFLLTAASVWAPASVAVPVAVFSKHLQWLDLAEAAAFAREVGFDALDLTVRPGGHLEPAQVAQLPRAAQTIRAQGVALAMITTAIAGAETPGVEAILGACRAAGVRFYRWGGWKYDRHQSLNAQLAVFREKAKALAEMNRQFGVCGLYHTHSGRSEFGASIWDIAACLDSLDPADLGVNFDLGHATVEGGLGGWMNALARVGPYLRGIAVKDFRWTQDAAGQWRPEWRPLGQGMVRLREFFQLVRAQDFQGPIQLHFEYPLGGAEEGRRQLTGSPNPVRDAMRRDLHQLRRALAP